MSFVEQLREELVTAAAREQARTGPRLQLPPLRPVAIAAAGLALTAILVIAVAGGLSTSPAPDDRPVGKQPAAGRELFPGTLVAGDRYRTRGFVPTLSFAVGDDNWYTPDSTSPDVFELSRVTRGRPGPAGPWPTLVFQRIGELYDPGVRRLKDARIPAPRDLEAWFTRHPDLRVSRSEPVTVAGVPGVSFLVEVRFTRPTHDDPACRERYQRPCTFLGPMLSLFDGMRLRMIQLRTEPDPLTIFTVAMSQRRFDALNRAAAPVLDSLRIGIR